MPRGGGAQALSVFPFTSSPAQSVANFCALKQATSIAPGLHLFTSNRLETLAVHLAERLREPLSSALAPEIVVVRNKGMERWLRQELARRHGVCANYEFPFPEHFGREIFQKLLPAGGSGATTRLDRDILTWRILRELPTLLERAEFAPLRHYLAGTPDDRKLIQLASRIANLFDQYLIFRPQMILDWDDGRSGRAGHDAGWQPILWRAVSADAREIHAARLRQRVAALLNDEEHPTPGLPQRLSIFGVSALPPFHLELFAGLAGRTQVNLFLLQPSKEYWGDITSPREDERVLKRRPAGGADAFQLHLERGNRLLASMGYLGRDFLKLLLDVGDWVPHEDFSEPGESSLLRAIQSDILHLRDRGRQPDCEPIALPASDDSVRIHSCHSPLREMEVLHDHLLDWFARDPSLAPRDIVVMTPEIETYAPFIHAVFGAPEDPARRIPYSVADRGARRQSSVIEAFLQLLDLPGSRLGAATVLELLEPPALRERFEITAGDLESIRRWVEETNIRWGADTAHQTALELPAMPGNTWRDGLDRLLLGYGMFSEDGRTFADILPYSDIEGDSAEVLGRFAKFLEEVFTLLRELPQPRTLIDWADYGEALVERFFRSTEDNAFDLQLIRSSLEDLRQQSADAGFDQPVSLDLLLERLRPALEDDLHPTGFLTGGVTFCGLKPMRSIPFQVICLVGMNDNVFPRPVQHLSFDLMARQPRLGDRSTREDDRYLFLETILSARARLHISYVGQSQRDNSAAPPSVLVSELLDYIEQGFTLAAPESSKAATSASLREHIVTRHRLQAFHEDYFTPDHRLFSYSSENCHASTASRASRHAPGEFFTGPLAEPDETLRRTTIEDLAAFLTNPARALLKLRLNLDLPEGAEELAESEPFMLDALAAYKLREELATARVITPADSIHHFETHRAAGELPPGSIGGVEFQRTSNAARDFLERLAAEELPGSTRADQNQPPVDLELGPFRLTGTLPSQGRRGRLLHRCAKARPKDRLRAWIHHLAANIHTPGQTTVFVGENATHVFRPPNNAAALLRALLEVYWTGLRAPLKFFPKTSFAYAEAAQPKEKKTKSTRSKPATNSAIAKARSAWDGNESRSIPGDKDDAYVRLCFQNIEPLDEAFETLALQICEPLLTHESVEETP